MSRVNTPNISTLYSFEEMQCADSIEWCPHEPNQNYFVCANYQLIGNLLRNVKFLCTRQVWQIIYLCFTKILNKKICAGIRIII